MKSKRIYRAAELIQKIVAGLLLSEVSDPRLKSVTITDVDLSPDFRQASVFFTLLDANPESIKAAETAFKKAASFFRVNVSKQAELRYTPELTFKYDMSVIEGERISNLLKDSGI